MTIRVSLGKNQIKILIGEDELEINVNKSFYQKVEGKDSYKMFFERAINDRIRKFVFKHRDRLSFLGKLKYLWNRNEVLVSTDEAVGKLVPREVLIAYLTLATDARQVNFVPG